MSLNIRSLSLVAAVAAVLVIGSGAANAQTLLFDNVSNAENSVTGASFNATGSTPNTFMGDGYVLRTGATSITGFDLFPFNGSGTNFTACESTFMSGAPSIPER